MAAVARELPADLPKSSTELPTILPISCTMQYFATGIIFTGDNQSMHVHIFGISVGN